MSSSVESRILTMKFENTAFQQGVNSTLSALTKLKEALVFNRGTGVEKIAADTQKAASDMNRAAASVDLSPMGVQVEGISAKFMAMSAIGVTAIAQVTSSMLSSATEMAKGFTLAPVLSGYDEYGLKLSAIQTIMSGTGESIGPVTKQLQELNTYSDRTIYSFKDMIDNIPKFTNAGVDLKTSVDAIKGIANVAALSGASANEAARAMYNLGQSIGQGTVKLMDWKSVELANMGTQDFKQNLIDTAVEMGTLTKTTEGLYQTLDGTEVNTKNFSYTLEKQWLTSEALVSTLQKYTDETTKLGTDAYKAATDIKTLTQMMDIFKESIGSGWANSFELIFGNLNQAKKLWGSVAQEIGGMITASADARNKILADWSKLGGRTAIIDSIRNVWNALGAVLGPIHDAFRDIFPRTTGAQLAKMSKALRDFTEGLIISKESSENLRDTFGGIFAVIGIAWEIAKGFIKYIITGIALVVEAFAPAGAGLLDLTGGVGDFLKSLHGILVEGGAIESFFDGLIEAREKVFGPLIHMVGTVLGAAFRLLAKPIGLVMDAFGYLGQYTDEFAEMVGWVERFLSAGLEKAGNWLMGFSDEFKAAAEAVKAFVQSGVEKIVEWFKSLGPYVDDAKELGIAIGEWAWDKIVEFANALVDAFEKLKPMIEDVGNAIKNSFGNVASVVGGIGSSIAGAIGGIGGIDIGSLFKGGDDAGSGATSGIEQMKASIGSSDGVVDKAKAAWEGFLDILKTIGEYLDPFIDKIGEGFKDFGSSIVSAFGTAKDAGGKAKDIFSAIGDVLGELFSAIGDGLVAAVKGIGGFLGEIIGAFDLEAIFAGINTAFFAYFSVMMARFLGNLGGMMGAAKKLMGSGEGVFNQLTSNLKTMQNGVRAEMILKIAIALGVLAVSLWILSKIPFPKLVTGLLAIGVMIRFLMESLKIMANKNLDPKQAASLFITASAMVVLSVAILAMSAAIAVLAQMDMGTLAKGLGYVALILGVMAAASYAFTASGAGASVLAAAAAILILSVALAMFAGTLLLYARMDMETIADGLKRIALVVIALGIAMGFLQGSIGGAAALGVLAISLAILVPVLEKMSKMDFGLMAKTVGALALGLLLIGGVAAIISVPLAALGIAILAIGVGLLAAGTGMLLFATGLATMAALGAGAAAVVVGMITSVVNTLPYIFRKLGEAMGVLARQIRKHAPAMGKAMQAGLEAIAKAITRAAPEIGRMMRAIGEQIIKTLRDFLPRLMRLGIDLLVMLLRGIKRNMFQIVPLGVDIMIKFLNGVKKKIDKLIEAGLDLVIAVITGIGDAIDDPARKQEIENAGESIASGLVGGITSFLRGAGMGLVNGAVSALADSIPGPIKKILNIDSPSKVFYELASYMVDGLVLGLDDGRARAGRSSEGLALETKRKFGMAMSKVATGLDANMDMSPRITPVLDLSDIQRNAGSIGSLLNGNVVASGISFSRAAAISAELDAIRGDRASTDVSTPREIKLTQINHSPKALGHVEIYRSTKNLVALAERSLQG